MSIILFLKVNFLFIPWRILGKTKSHEILILIVRTAQKRSPKLKFCSMDPHSLGLKDHHIFSVKVTKKKKK